ncbi:MAG: ABC transporter permease [Candidatus Hermodarchaeota archaeon]
MVSQTSTSQITKQSWAFLTKFELRSIMLFSILMFFFSFFMFLPIISVSISAFNFTDSLDFTVTSLGSILGNNFFDFIKIPIPNFFKHFLYCFENPAYRRSILNTLFAGLTTTIICSIIGLTVTIIFSRYTFFGKKFFQVLTVLPLVSPPFVGALAVSRLLDKNGIVTNFLQLIVPGLPSLLTSSIWGIIFLQSIHLWPLIFFNTSASYSKIDPAQEEQARNLGSWSLNLYRQIILPLITPGFIAGAVLVFMWSIGDLGTPIVLNFPEFAPYLAFREIKDERKVDIESALALVIILLVVSLIALFFASKIVGMKDYAPEKVSGMDQVRMMQKASRSKSLLILTILTSLLVISLLPHIGIILVAFIDRIRYGEIIPTLWTLDGIQYTIEKTDAITLVFNSLIYSTLAMLLTISIGIIVGYLLIRKKNLKGISIVMLIIGVYIGLLIGAQLSRGLASVAEKNLMMIGSTIIIAGIFFVIGRTFNLRCLEIFSTMPFAVPGIVLAIGYLTFFAPIDTFWGFLPPQLDTIPIIGLFTAILRQILLSIANSPLEFRFSEFWFIFVVSYSVRRMPYAVQSSTAVLRQIHESLEEVAYNLGASTASTLRRVTIPLMASGVLAGGVLTFITSFTEVSTSIVITPIKNPFSPIFPFSRKSDPLTKGIYDEISRGGEVMPAGILGLVQLLVATIGMAITQRLLGERTGTAFGG